MATTTQAAPQTEPFPSISSATLVAQSSSENPNLLRPHSSAKSDVSAAGSSPLPLTGAAAMAEVKRRKHQEQRAQEEDRQTSPNPAITAVYALMGAGGLSKAADAPDPSKLSEPLRKAAEKISIPESGQDESLQTSPVSLSSFDTIENTGAGMSMTVTAGNAPNAGHLVAEPAQMTDGGSYPGASGLRESADQDAVNKVQSYTYPGPPPMEQIQEGGPSRGMSLPMSGYGQSSPKSPASNKRHKCPYCSTDFTRHHNLKSHLLTHSQEKPYVCQTCQARFRRLHDLKRHTKLHTGERPHTCDKCGRRFARGDALARHNKGPGGCAGRRSSFGGDDDFEGGPGVDGMDGVEYNGEGDDDEEENMDDGQGRRGSEPSRKRTHLETQEDAGRHVYQHHSSTYPPVASRAMRNSVSSNMGPPAVVHPGSSTATSPHEVSNQASPVGGSSLGSSYYSSAPGQVFAQAGAMTESPKPLSPGQPDPHQQQRLAVSGDLSMHRNRSPSLTTQFQQALFGRGSGRGTPPAGFPQQVHVPSHPPPQLPSLPGLSSQPQGRPSLQPSAPQGQGGPGPSMLQHQQLPPAGALAHPGSQQDSMSSHGNSSANSMRDVVGHDPNELWSYVRQLEQRFSRMSDEYELRISRLQEEVIALKGQMQSGQASYSSDMGQNRY